MQLFRLGWLPLLGLLLLSATCNRELSMPEVEKAITFEDMLLFDYQAGTPDWAHIRISHQHSHNEAPDHTLAIAGSVQTSYPFNTPIDGGDMYVGGIELPQATENPGFYGPIHSHFPDRSLINAHLGRTTSFALEGNRTTHIPNFETEAYLPPLIEAEFTLQDLSRGSFTSLDLKHDISIEWNADTLNDMPMIVWVAFNHGVDYSPKMDPEQPYEEIILASRIFRRMEVDDDGSFLIAADPWYWDIPPGEPLEVGIARGTQQTSQKGEKSLRVYYRTASVKRFELTGE